MHWGAGALAGVLAVAAAACDRAANEPGSSTPSYPSTDTSISGDAKPDIVVTLREDLQAERHPSDGGGSAWIVEPASRDGEIAVVARSRQRFEIIYEAGPLGVAEGGAVFLQPSPFWGWNPPQIEFPKLPGYTQVETDAQGIELHPAMAGSQYLAITIAGRRLEEGERIRIVYGAGEAGAQVDQYAERDSRLWIAVDGDGDGVRSIVADSPSVHVTAARAAHLLLFLPTTARPGERVRFTVAVVDDMGNSGVAFRGEVFLSGLPSGLEIPERIALESRHLGHRTVEGHVTAEGVYRLTGLATSADEGGPDLVAESNPLIVREGIPHLLWGDLHGHSQISDGTGTPEDYYRYARDVTGLDVAALTDHDHWGVRFLDQTPELWQAIREAARQANEPGRFVTLVGYEWTSWLHGHRHVLYFSDEGEILSSIDPRYETPTQLWRALAGRQAMTIAHHSAGGPISTNWDYVPDPLIEPVTEVVSVHGQSEAPDMPGSVRPAENGNFVRDILDRGLRFGFIGSGDGHDGHPGLGEIGFPRGGLAAVFSEELSREGVRAALEARRVYATNGPRIWLRTWLDDHPMGSVLPATRGSSGVQTFRFAVAAETPIERVDVVRSGQVVESLVGDGAREWSGEWDVPPLSPGEYIYLRALQEDGGAAWSSPIYAN